MTKEQFLNGQSFRVVGQNIYYGAPTFVFKNEILVIETRSTIDEEILFERHHMTITVGCMRRFACRNLQIDHNC